MSCWPSLKGIGDATGLEGRLKELYDKVGNLEDILGGASLDAFGRMRVSEPQTIFDSKQLYDKRPDIWDESTTGTGSTTYNTNQASTNLDVAAGTGVAIRQTFQRFNYQPGKSQRIFMTGVMGNGAPNVNKSFGIFDDDNGLFFHQSASELSFVRRSKTTGSVVDDKIIQSSWNMDKLDGTGESGYTLDPTKTQILIIDFEWLGVGAVRMGFVIDGIIVYCHKFNNANNLTTVYMSTPNLPLRYEIRANSALNGQSLVHICAEVSSEGGVDPIGCLYAADRGASRTPAVGVGVTYPLVSIRLKSGREQCTVIPELISVLAETNNNDFRWALIINATLTGPSWTSVDTESNVEFDVSSTAVSGGLVQESGYANEDVAVAIPPRFARHLGVSLAGVYDTLTLAATNATTSGNERYFGAINWREVV